jgi:hypothetical protein
VGQGVEDSDEAREFFFGAVFGASEDLDEVVRGEERAEHQQAREVELASGNGLQQQGEAAHEAGGSDTAIRFVFGEAQLVDAVGVEARAGTSAVDAARFDLAEVR